MSSFEQAITQAWYRRGVSWVWLLFPLTILFICIRLLRQFCLKPQAISAPVVVVGNISVGGTGKTPLIIRLCKLADELGYKPGVVSRGFGSDAPHYPYQVNSQSPVNESGDEALLIATKTQVPVVIGSDRVAAAKQLVTLGCNLIFSDDGLQHYRLCRDAEIVVVDSKRLFGNGFQLPAGPLREPLSRLKSVDAVVVNGAMPPPAVLGEGNNLPLLVMQVAAREFVHLQSNDVLAKLDTTRAYYAVTGIGNPDRFFNSLRGLGIQFTPVVFGDHHPFSAADFGELTDMPVIMTEKDAVKCIALAKGQFSNHEWFALSVESQLDDSAVGQLKALIDTAVAQHRSKML